MRSQNPPGHKETKQKIGTLRLPVEEVVRNSKIRDSWALQARHPAHCDWLTAFCFSTLTHCHLARLRVLKQNALTLTLYTATSRGPRWCLLPLFFWRGVQDSSPDVSVRACDAVKDVLRIALYLCTLLELA